MCFILPESAPQNERQLQQQQNKIIRRVLRNNFISTKSWLRRGAKYRSATVVGDDDEQRKKSAVENTWAARQTDIRSAALHDENSGAHTLTKLEYKWMDRWIGMFFFSFSLADCAVTSTAASGASAPAVLVTFWDVALLHVHFFLSYAFFYCFGLVLLLPFSSYYWLLFHLMLYITCIALAIPFRR